MGDPDDEEPGPMVVSRYTSLRGMRPLPAHGFSLLVVGDERRAW